jgi:pimeloyl-ACP methyl ester carboxylesterase
LSDAAPPDLTAYDRLRWSAAELEALLASGQHRRELQAYFGQHDYQRLAALARRAAARRARASRPRVYVIPGILGSELGRPRPPPWPADLLWVDPIDIIDGRLAELELVAGAAIVPLSVLPPTYAPLQLELRAAGCEVVMHAYDWRRSILETGRELAAVLAADPAPEIHVIAHSMGGLLARVALAASPGLRLARLITVGTPHAGSFAPLQALRGTYPVVRRLAALDRRHDAEQLAADIFGSFPSLYEMLPTRAAGCDIDLFEPGNWPAGRPAPRAALLRAARGFAAALAPLDERCVTIVGVGQRTVTALERSGEEFSYAVTGDGDGTVPARSAAAAGGRCLFFRGEHSELLRSRTVARALIELVHSGRTAALQRASSLARQAPVRVRDSELRGVGVEKIDWHALAPEARRLYLQHLNVPPPQYLRRRPRRGA